jgi:hypothetical protein
MGLRIVDCHASETRIAVFFSDKVDSGPAKRCENYAVTDLSGKALFTPGDVYYDPDQKAAFFAAKSLTKGNWIAVTVTIPFLAPPDNTFATRVNGDDNIRGATGFNTRGATRAVEDAVSYPILTEEVGFASSPAAPSPVVSAPGSGGAGLGAMVTKAVGDVLGWKVKADDVKGFMGALNASFTGEAVDGNTAYKWTPRTYAVQTDLSGGITGAQASLYTRAKDALDKSVPLLDGLYPLDPDADAEDITALRAVARSQLTELVNEFAFAGGPRVSRVNQYFQMLITFGLPDPAFPPASGSNPITDPDQIRGTLGNLRDELGLRTDQDFVNTVEDEQDLSNFRILSDYVTSLAQSWINNLGFFFGGTQQPFFGTQLVLLSRQLSEVAETVDEVRFTLDSVFIGPAERQTLQLQLGPGVPPLFIEDLLTWIQGFAATEGPQLIQDGGKLAVQNSFLPIAQQLQDFIKAAQDRNLNRQLPRGFHTSRVQRALEELGDGLDELVSLAKPITHAAVAEPTPAQLQTLIQPQLIAFPSSVLNFAENITTAQTVTLTNDSSAIPLSIGNIALIPKTTRDFIVVDSPPPESTLQPGASTEISLKFTPTPPLASDPRNAQLVIPWSVQGTAALSPLRIDLTGVAISRTGAAPKTSSKTP